LSSPILEEDIEIRTADGVAGGFLYRADDRLRRPGVIHLTDIGGIRPAQREMARRLAEQGYAVLMPNVFYRTGKPPFFKLPLNLADERTKTKFAELSGPLTPEGVERDASAYVDFLAASDFVSKGGMGAVGYCFSGAVAMRTAAALPDRIVAAASFHGGRLFTDAPTSPHLLVPRIKAQLYFGHAIKDGSMPEEAIRSFEAALAAWGGQYESETYEGAYHGWTTLDSPAYNEAQAERAFGKLTKLLGEALRRAAVTCDDAAE